MAIKAIAAGVAAVATVVGTVQSNKNQKKAIREQQKAMRFERQKSELQSMRQRTDAVRATRDSLARAQQTASNQGVSTSSAAMGGQGSIQSQGRNNISFLDQYGFYSDMASKHLERGMGFSGKASMWGAVAGLGAQAYAATGGLNFKGPPPPENPGG